MLKLINRIGQKYGRLTVISRDNTRDPKSFWKCICDCGNSHIVSGDSLQSGSVKSCGCYLIECRKERYLHLENKKFNRLTPIKKIYKKRKNGKNKIYWECLCDCGNKCLVQANKIKSGHTKSCGCLHSEITSKNNTVKIIGKKFGRLTVIEKISGKYHHKSIKYKCLCSCGKNIIVDGGNLRNGHTRSCGCLFAELKGENHPSWNPLLTQEDRELRRDFKIKQWGMDVFKRDNFICNICGIRGYRLNAHHKESYNSCKEKRYDIDNGITLCVKCHSNFHKKYGRGYNTEKQYNKFFRKYGKK